MKKKPLQVKDKTHLLEILQSFVENTDLLNDISSSIDDTKFNENITYSEEYIKPNKKDKPKKLKISKVKTLKLKNSNK